MKTLLKVLAALMALGVIAVLFVRSAQSARAEPFTIARQNLTGWTLTIGSDTDELGSLLSITTDSDNPAWDHESLRLLIDDVGPRIAHLS